MRKALLLYFLLLFVTKLEAQPAAFQWPAAAANNQKEQGPCNDFASVNLLQTWFYCLFGTRDQISTAHPYSQCGGANAGAGSNIPSTLAFFQADGGVDARTLPWVAHAACNTAQSDPYFLDKIVSGNTSTLINGDCGTPYLSCIAGDGAPSIRYKIAGFAQLSNIGQLTPNQLKLAIMNDGPIVINMVDPQLHGTTPHAYLLYGWNAQGAWLLTDSWPTGFSTGLNQTNQNLDSLFAAVGNTSAYYLTNSVSNPGVWREDYEGLVNNIPTWAQDAATTISTAGCIYPACSNAFTISGPSTVTTSGSTFTVNNTGLLTNATITWSYDPGNYNGAVNFTPATGTSTTVTAARTGTVNVVANIKRPNGLCEKVKVPVNVIGTNIPFTLAQTENGCSGSTRFIQYQATSTYPLTCSWTLHPPGTGGVFTTTNGCTFTMDFTILPSSYGITMTVTSSALPGALDGGTTGGPAMSCVGGHSIARDSLTGSTSAIAFGDGMPFMVAAVQVAPNPASGIVSLRLPPSRAYEVKLFTTQGSVIFAAHSATSSLNIDVSRFANGVYIIQTRDMETGEITVKKVLVQK